MGDTSPTLSFGSELRATRKQNKVRLKDVAVLLGTSTTYISGVESGSKPCSAYQAWRLTELIGPVEPGARERMLQNWLRDAPSSVRRDFNTLLAFGVKVVPEDRPGVGS